MNVVTIFPNLKPRTSKAIPFVDFERILTAPPRRASKETCELFSLARYGDQRSASGLLRHDDNVLVITGIVGDYDGGKKPMEEARDALGLWGIKAILKTSGSYSDAAPKWHVLCPLSRELPKEQHAHLMARLNGALGGILAGESFTLSQSFYFGAVNGVEYRTLQTGGLCIDELPELDDMAIGKNGAQSAPGNGASSGRLSDQELRELIVHGVPTRIYPAMLSLSARLAKRGSSVDKITDDLRALLNVAEWQERDAKTWHERYADAATLAESAVKKYAPPTPVFMDPLPLPKLPAVPAFPPELLPEGLRLWVCNTADVARFDPSYMAIAAMVGLGSLLGRKLGIRLKAKDDWTEYANVWGSIIGTPSALKSPALRYGLRPVKALQLDADREHATAMQEWELEAEARKLRHKAKTKATSKRLEKDPDADIELVDDDAPDKPIARCYWTSNATVEKLGELAVENPNGLLIERDELSALLKALEDERQSEARGFYLSGWSAQEGYRFDRILRGTTFIPKYALSIVGGIQPGPLSRFVRAAQTGEQADGFLQRLQLIVWPDACDFEYVDRYPDTQLRREATDLFARFDAFTGRSIGEPVEFFRDDPPFIRLDAEAQGLFVEWYSDFMRQRRAVEADGSEAGSLASHFGKYPGLLGKLTLILHVADDPDGTAVSVRTLRKALAWLDYLAPHARRVYHAAQAPETQAAELLLARLRRGALPAQFRAWEITRNCWHGLADREAVRRACRLLFEHGWLYEIEADAKPTGRPADPVYAVNPVALGEK